MFGQAMKKKGGGKGGSTYQRQMGNRRGKGSMGVQRTEEEEDEWQKRKSEFKEQKRKEGEALDAKMGYERFDTPNEVRTGWSFNVLPTTVPGENGVQKAGLDVYFLQDDKKTFKATGEGRRSEATTAYLNPS